MQKVIGVVHHLEAEGGFWGIVADNGNQYEIIDMPEQLKHDKAKVKVVLEELDVFTLYMWGTPCKIISFQTLHV